MGRLPEISHLLAWALWPIWSLPNPDWSRGKVTAGAKWTTCGVVLLHLWGEKRDIFNLIFCGTLDCSLSIVMGSSRLNFVSLQARVPWKMCSHTCGSQQWPCLVDSLLVCLAPAWQFVLSLVISRVWLSQEPHIALRALRQRGPPTLSARALT